MCGVFTKLIRNAPVIRRDLDAGQLKNKRNIK